jgi:hypothetical protein
MPRHVRNDPVKVALADLVFAATKHALDELPGTALAPEHEPLEDCVCVFVPISDLESIIQVKGTGKSRFFSIKVHEDKT